MYKDVKDGKEVIVCVVGSTTLLYDYRCLGDLHTMLEYHGDWMELGSADEQNLSKMERLKPGEDRKIIRSAVGMDLKKDFAEGLECMFRH